MNKFCLITLLLTVLSITQLPAMEQPPRTWSKPLPPIPGKQPVTTGKAPVISSQPASTPNAKPATLVSLTPAQEKSITKITESINKLMENNASIAKHAIALGKSGSSDIFGSVKESGMITAKLASSTASIGSIYVNVDSFSNASPEIQAIARKRIMAVIDSPQFKASETELIKLAADDSLPSFIREPLRKLASQIAELPGYIVKKYLGEEFIPEAR